MIIVLIVMELGAVILYGAGLAHHRVPILVVNCWAMRLYWLLQILLLLMKLGTDH